MQCRTSAHQYSGGCVRHRSEFVGVFISGTSRRKIIPRINRSMACTCAMNSSGSVVQPPSSQFSLPKYFPSDCIAKPQGQANAKSVQIVEKVENFIAFLNGTCRSAGAASCECAEAPSDHLRIYRSYGITLKNRQPIVVRCGAGAVRAR